MAEVDAYLQQPQERPALGEGEGDRHPSGSRLHLERKPRADAVPSQGDAQQASPLRATAPALRCRSGDAQQAPLPCATAPRTLLPWCHGMRRRRRRATLYLLVVVTEDELNFRNQEVSGDLANACASTRTALDVVALE